MARRPRDLVISCFAFAGIPSEVRFDSAPAVILWPGKMPAPGRGVHPTWGDPARELRATRTDGRLLPALINRFRISTGLAWDDPAYDSPARIAAIGFSAGFGGVRALLTDPRDADRIDVVALVDTPHAPESNTGSGHRAGIHWPALEPFAAFATRAAAPPSAGVSPAAYVATWGDIETPDGVVSAGRANRAIFAEVEAEALSQRWPLEAFVPAELREPHTVDGKPAPLPDRVQGIGNAIGLHYPGRDARSHIIQGQRVQVDLWRFFLARRWNGPGGPVSRAPAFRRGELGALEADYGGGIVTSYGEGIEGIPGSGALT